MSSIPNETQQTIENIYGDFQEYLQDGSIEQAKECITHMNDYSTENAKKMQKELQDSLNEA